ncbi:MAG: SDR family NAD(P)-dependent oxidoreductase, partial [Betaproteobacteria bacterium]
MAVQGLPAEGRELAGQVALVTGGAKNIGRAISLALAAAGAAVAVNTLRSREDAEAVVQEIRGGGGDAEAYVADIADAASVRAMGEGVMKRFGRIDILVLNASQRREVLFKDMSFEEWRATMSITLDGSFHCIKACLPSMLANRRGNIVTLAGDAVL